MSFPRGWKSPARAEAASLEVTTCPSAELGSDLVLLLTRAETLRVFIGNIVCITSAGLLFFSGGRVTPYITFSSSHPGVLKGVTHVHCCPGGRTGGIVWRRWISSQNPVTGTPSFKNIYFFLN